MPSHIYVQRGMWEQVKQSNIVAYKAAVDLNTKLKLAEGREDFHTLGWLGYANLMLGEVEESKKNVEWRRRPTNPTNAGIRDGYLAARPAHPGVGAVGSSNCPRRRAGDGDYANMPGMNAGPSRART
jgi:hypothetical protein